MSCGGGSDSIESDPDKQNEAPSVPAQVFPLNNTLCIDNTVNFEWEPSIDQEQNPVEYRLEIAEDNSFSPSIINQTVNSTLRAVILERGKRFYWRVKAIDSNRAESAYSTPAQFIVEADAVSNYAPFAPVLVLPKMNSEIDGLTATLSWTSSDADEDVLSYDVYLDTVNPPIAKVSENQLATSFDTGTLAAATTYYFRVNVKDGKGVTTVGPVWSFTTKL